MTRLAANLVTRKRRSGRFALVAGAALAAAMLVVPTALASPESDAADAINNAWNSAGGSDSPVGSKDGDVYAVGTGYGQKFTDGKIFFTPDAGAHLIYGAILDKYESLGGAGDSDLGFPTINEVAGLVGPDSRVSTFNGSDKPAIFWTPDTGAFAVRGAINAAWDKLGGSAGTLGVPVEDERYDGDVVSQKFTGGEISWNRATNTFTTDPAQLADSLTGLEVPLDPTTLINLTWRSTGGLGGPLGARQGEQATIGDNGAAQGYAGGKIFYSPQTGAHAVTGAILSRYESAGGATGDLGFPVGVETEGGVPNSRVNAFSAPDKPIIFWTPDSGAVIVRGAINAAWDKLGGATGALGVPTEDQTVNGDTVTQKFNGGEISFNQATKEFTTKPAELAADLKGLELPDTVAQTPAGSGEKSATSTTSFHWWWLAIILPLLALLGLLLARASRRGGDDVADDSLGEHGDDRVSTYSYDSDEDAIDTAPTRVPTEADLADFSYGDDDWTRRSGRHSTDGADTSAPWQLDLADLPAPRRRHAVDEGLWEAEPRFDWGAPESGGDIAEVRFEAESVTRSYADTTVGERDPENAGVVDSDDEPWHPAIHLPLADPYQPPEGYYIKANTHSGLYYTPDSELYDNTVPEVWFASEDVAQANGFVKAPE